MKKFTNLYSAPKTLRFELIPIGKTKENLENSDLISQDEHRAESYKKVKKIIDRYHKQFIENVLSNTELIYKKEGNFDSLEEYFQLYIIDKKTDNDKKKLENIQDKLRKQIIKAFKDNDLFKRIDKKELIREDILSIIEPEEKSIVEEFSDFTTYFTGFHENRKNMYSEEKKSTSIAYRLIHENLPKFVDNIFSFIKISKTSVANYLQILYSEMEDALKEKDDSLDVSDIEEMFRLDYYNSVLTQKKIDLYNSIIGGMTKKDGTQIKGINNYVKEYNDQIKPNETKLPKLKPLFKQILSDRERISWLPEEFDSDQELLESVRDFYNELINNNVIIKIREILLNIEDYNIDEIYIPNSSTLTDVSQKLFGDWARIKNFIVEDIKKCNPIKKTEKEYNYENRINGIFKKNDGFSIYYLNSLLSEGENIISYITSFGNLNNKDKLNIFQEIENTYSSVQTLLNEEYPNDKKLSQDLQNVNNLKCFLDKLLQLQHFVKPFLEIENQSKKDERFYSELSILMEEFNLIIPLYNKVRNHMTRKPYSTEKFKLTFNIKGNFLGGWVDSKTAKSDNGTQYGGYLFRKKNSIGEFDYYLGVSSNTKLFRKIEGASGQYERLDYYQPKSQTVYGNSYVGENGYESDKKDLMNSIVSYINTIDDMSIRQQVVNKDTPSAMIIVLKELSPQLYQGLLEDPNFSKVNRMVTDNLHQTILSMSRIPRSKDYKNVKFSLFTEPQQVIEDICKDKVFGYFTVDDKEISDAMESTSKPFLLFKISNKDLSFAEKFEKGLRKSRGKDNLHTMYFKYLMRGCQSVLDIGSGEVFFRKASINANITHPANKAIKNKNKDNEKKESCFDYDLIKDKRYTVDKFSFHLSIIQNYQSPSKYDVNAMAREYIRNNPDIYIIGIDRGERHLLYVSVINSKGQIVEQIDMNEMKNEYKSTNYHWLLEQRSDKLKQDRQSWKTIEGIKDLKHGYLSLVIHKIVTLIMKYKAIVVLEDLNPGFKRGRQKVESSVYQQFEKALIDKLNYLVDKQKDVNEHGGLLKGLQLTNKFTSFKDMGNQNGFLFYIPAWNTSKIDPVTGFVDLLHPKYESVEKSREFFNKFKEIKYNNEKGWYEFVLDYNDFTTKAEGTRTDWTLCTHGTRIKTFSNKEKNSSWDCVEVDLTKDLNSLFNKYSIPLTNDMKDDIVRQTDTQFFKDLTKLLALTLQMRNSVTDTDIDYLISPVANEDGVFYDSRTCEEDLPKNADANGAYNIARKGLWCAKQIQETSESDKINLAISNKEWLRFVQTKPYLND